MIGLIKDFLIKELLNEEFLDQSIHSGFVIDKRRITAGIHKSASWKCQDDRHDRSRQLLSWWKSGKVYWEVGSFPFSFFVAHYFCFLPHSGSFHRLILYSLFCELCLFIGGMTNTRIIIYKECHFLSYRPNLRSSKGLWTPTHPNLQLHLQETMVHSFRSHSFMSLRKYMVLTQKAKLIFLFME